jgi:hypothetical protein
MYYPYFRGKQFELIILRDKAEFIKENKIHAIIEPVKNSFGQLTKAVKSLEEAKADFTLIVNPKASSTDFSSKQIMDEIICKECDKHCNIGVILQSDKDVRLLSELLKEYKDKNFTLIHFGYDNPGEVKKLIENKKNVKTNVFIDGLSGKLYQRNFVGSKRVLIRDGFIVQRNADYPSNEHFSDLHATFRDEGMDGFGDFLIVGDEYSETGGPAHAVAIHLTYLNKDEDMYIYHFVSDTNGSPLDPAGKFLEALDKMIRKASDENSMIFKSPAFIEYENLYKIQHYPGLGLVKKLSMLHHMELIADYLKGK